MKTQLEENIKKIRVGLNWTSGREYGFDLDLSAFLLDEKDLARSEEDFVFYNNTSSAGEALAYSGDDRSGMVDGVNESILILRSTVRRAVRWRCWNSSEAATAGNTTLSATAPISDCSNFAADTDLQPKCELEEKLTYILK